MSVISYHDQLLVQSRLPCHLDVVVAKPARFLLLLSPSLPIISVSPSTSPLQTSTRCPCIRLRWWATLSVSLTSVRCGSDASKPNIDYLGSYNSYCCRYILLPSGPRHPRPIRYGVQINDRPVRTASASASSHLVSNHSVQGSAKVQMRGTIRQKWEILINGPCTHSRCETPRRVHPSTGSGCLSYISVVQST
jgi:hypothetical protein